MLQDSSYASSATTKPQRWRALKWPAPDEGPGGGIRSDWKLNNNIPPDVFSSAKKLFAAKCCGANAVRDIPRPTICAHGTRLWSTVNIHPCRDQESGGRCCSCTGARHAPLVKTKPRLHSSWQTPRSGFNSSPPPQRISKSKLADQANVSPTILRHPEMKCEKPGNNFLRHG